MNTTDWPENLLALWQRLRLSPQLWQTRQLPWFAEGPVQPCYTDRFQRTQAMCAETWQAWQAMQDAAARDGIELEIISAYRSWAQQAAIWERKLAAGQAPEEILRWSAPPGLSEHHTGRALDLAAGEDAVLSPAFAESEACQWLRMHAARFGFHESYPSGNSSGFQPEPWHWCWQA